MPIVKPYETDNLGGWESLDVPGLASTWFRAPAPWAGYELRVLHSAGPFPWCPVDHGAVVGGIVIELRERDSDEVFGAGLFAWDARPGVMSFADEYQHDVAYVCLFVAEARRGQRLSDLICTTAERLCGRTILPPTNTSGTMQEVWPRRRGWSGAPA